MSHLWAPLAWLAKSIEFALTTIQANIASSWGLTIVIFSILLKLLLLPVGIMTVRFQRRVSQVQAQLTPQLAAIGCPVLVLCGSHDAWSPAAQHRQIAAAIPGAELELVEACGHMAPMERPHAVTTALRRWLGMSR